MHFCRKIPITHTNTKKMLNKKTYLTQFFVLLILTFGGLLLSSTLGVVITVIIYGTPNILETCEPATAIRITQTIVSLGTFILPALLFSFMQDKKWFSYNFANRKPHPSFVNTVLILSFTILPIVGLTTVFNENIMPTEGTLFEWMKNTENNANNIIKILTSQQTSWALISNLLVLALIPGICEEFLFQGALQPLLTYWTKNPHIGIFVTAFIFSTIHLQFYGFIPRFFLGLYLGYLLYWSKSLWLPILAHTLHNGLSILIEFTLQGRGIDTNSMKYTDVHGIIPVALCCILITAMGIVFMWRTHKDLKIS